MFQHIRIKPSFYSLIYSRRFALGIGVFVLSTWISYYLFSTLKSALHLQDAFSTAYYGLILEREAFVELSFFEEYFLAFLACLMGQYFFFEFLFFKPYRSFHRPLARTLILTNNRNVLLNFIAVGGKFFLTLAVFYWGFVFSFEALLPWIYSILVLLIITLHLQAWTSIRQFYSQSLGWMLVLFLVYGGIAFGLAKYAKISFKPTLESIWETRPEAQLKIELPKGEYLRANNNNYSYINIPLYAGYKKADKTLQLLKKEKAQKAYPLDSFDYSLMLKKHKLKIPQAYHNNIGCLLAMDKKTKLVELETIRSLLLQNGIINIFYATNPSEFQEPIDYKEIGFWRKTRLMCPQLKKVLKSNMSIVKIWEGLKNETLCSGDLEYIQFWADKLSTYKTLIELKENNQVHLNGEKTNYQKIKPQIKSLIREQKEKLGLFIQMHPDASYQSYISLMENIDMAYWELWKEKGGRQFQLATEVDELPLAYQIKIKREYPKRIWESFNLKEKQLIEYLTSR